MEFWDALKANNLGSMSHAMLGLLMRISDAEASE